MATHEYLGNQNDVRERLRADITVLMLKGAGYAAIFTLSIVLVILFIAWVGDRLPEESREQPDPTPMSALKIETGSRIV